MWWELLGYWSFVRGVWRWLTSRSTAATIALAGGLFVSALVVMAVLAGWETVADQLRPRLSFWFAVAFAAELVAFVGYVFAYRSVAHIENWTSDRLGTGRKRGRRRLRGVPRQGRRGAGQQGTARPRNEARR